jgi:hypothetical protein
MIYWQLRIDTASGWFSETFCAFNCLSLSTKVAALVTWTLQNPFQAH